jgi:signal transduction histidine kinase
VRSRILAGYLGLVVVVLAALEIPLGVQFGRSEQRTLETKVEHDATTIASIAPDTLRRPTRRRLQAIAGVAYGYRRDTGGRVVIVNRKGRAVIDTNPRGTGVTSFASRPEIAAALRGNVASGTRESKTLHTRLLYVAVPVAANGRVEGAARITYPTSAVDSRIRRYRLALAAIAAIVIAVAVVVGLAVATFISRPLSRLEGAAEAVGAGDLTARAPEHEGPPEVRSLAAVFNETVAKLDQLLRSQEEFVADASHQLRTPLTALRLRLENLTRDVALPGRAELDGAVAEVARLGSLVEALLALARADTSRERAGRVDVDLVVRERVRAWSALADERGVRVTTVGAAAATARTTEERLRQVLDNLLENALEISPHDGTITVETRSAPPWIELRIRDEGPGLKPEERERAFDRFWRNRTGEGSGLGLAIVRRLVEQDGGNVQLLDEVGQGLEAVVRLRPA